MDRVICKGMEKPEQIVFKLREEGNIVYKEIPFRNYIYILEADYIDCEFSIKKYLFSSAIVTDNKGVEYRKLNLKNNYHRNFLKKALEEELGVDTFEADIDGVKRFLIDNQNIPLNQHLLSYVSIDLETFDLYPLEKDFSGRVSGNYPILSVSLKDFNGESYFIRNKGLDNPNFDNYRKLYKAFVILRSDPKEKLRANKIKKHIKTMEDHVIKALEKGEKELLALYGHLIERYDVALAYNGGRFDYPYLKDRYELHSLNYRKHFIVDMDYMEVYKKNAKINLKSYSLNNVAKFELKDSKDPNVSDEAEKVDWRKKTGLKKVFELFLLEPKILEEYNNQDVNLIIEIEKKLKLLKIHEVSAKLSHSLIINTMYNSKQCDYLMLNEYKKRNIIKNSKPNNQEVDKRNHPILGQYPGGGYTYATKIGIHDNVECFDQKSFYPTTAITYNISPETYVKTIPPDLELVFTSKQIVFLADLNDLKFEYLNKMGKLKKSTYERAIESLRIKHKIEETPEELMWLFVELYKNDKLTLHLKKNNYVSTPADINYDTRGWTIHPHRVFDNQTEGVFPHIAKFQLLERDKIKYTMNKHQKYSSKWWSLYIYQYAIKTNANSLYGYFAFKAGREFMVEIPEAITTSCRATIKKCILFAKTLEWETTHGDTDSSYLKNNGSTLSINDLEVKYFNYFNELVKDYNTNCAIELKHPKTKESVICKHFIVFEHEQTMRRCLVEKKKKYYYKVKDKLSGEYRYETKGGKYKKADTIKIAADLQKEMVKELLDESFDKKYWISKLISLKKDVYSYKLDKEVLIKNMGISKSLDDYGKPVIDGDTGKQKMRKSDGQPMFSPIPAHIKIALSERDNGVEIEVGDKIDYIVAGTDKKKIIPISVTDYEKDQIYDCDYYWASITAGLIEVLEAVFPKTVYTEFGECWKFNDKQLKRLDKNLRMARNIS